MDSVLSSRKTIPEMKAHSPLKQSWLLLLLLFFFFFYNRRPGYTSLHHLNFMLATALQRRQSNSKGKEKQTGFFAFPVFICRLTSSSKRPSNPYSVLHL